MEVMFMTIQERLVKQKLSLFQLAEELNNVRKACKIIGVSHDFYYKHRKRFEKHGIEGLKEKQRKRPDMPNQTKASIEQKILDYSLENPTFGKNRVSLELRIHGIWISPSGIASIWNRNNMRNKNDRLKKLELKMRETGFALSDDQLESIIFSADKIKDSHVISFYPGYLLCQDTFQVGYIKGIGKIYMQTVVDTYGSFAHAKLYSNKTSITAADVLVDRVFPFYNQFRIPILNVLTDNGSEYCGDPNNHNYEILLSLFHINHRRTKVRRPQTNGFVERFHRTVLEEFFVVAFRKKWYHSIELLQSDLDNWLFKYNFKRAHQGYRVKGKTPAQIIFDLSKRQKCLPG